MELKIPLWLIALLLVVLGAVVGKYLLATGQTPAGLDASGRLCGKPFVIDGDTLQINGVRVRLKGVEAVERHQPCCQNGKEWKCGRIAKAKLIAITGKNDACCYLRRNESGVYKRGLGYCFVAHRGFLGLSMTDGLDINNEMVRQGWAFSTDEGAKFAPAESQARKNLRGYHQSGVEFISPKRWRRYRGMAKALKPACYYKACVPCPKN